MNRRKMNTDENITVYKHIHIYGNRYMNYFCN